RLATGVERAAFELEGVELLAGSADGHHLGMSGGIFGAGDAVDPFGHDLALSHDNRGERPAISIADVFNRKGNRALHERFIAHSSIIALLGLAGWQTPLLCQGNSGYVHY